MESLDHVYMGRCLQLAALGAGRVAPNPMVGAVLVYKNRILGEGYHRAFGKAHAEVECIESVSEEDRTLISQSTLYVSLEPCSFVGKTPACSKLIIDQKIPRVVVATVDPHPRVSGKGIEALQAAGISVKQGLLSAEAKELNKHFFCYHQQSRPYVHLKWAQTEDGNIADAQFNPIKISHSLSDIRVHKMRTNHMAILVGVHTVLTDNPRLNARYWPGKNPIRVCLDKTLQIQPHHRFMQDDAEQIIFNFQKDQRLDKTFYIRLKDSEPVYPQILKSLYNQGIHSLMVEGGAHTLQAFIDAGVWDEATVITNLEMKSGKGVAAPVLKNFHRRKSETILNNRIENFTYEE